MLNGFSNVQKWAGRKQQVILQTPLYHVTFGKNNPWNLVSCDHIRITRDLSSCCIAVAPRCNGQKANFIDCCGSSTTLPRLFIYGSNILKLFPEVGHYVGRYIDVSKNLHLRLSFPSLPAIGDLIPLSKRWCFLNFTVFFWTLLNVTKEHQDIRRGVRVNETQKLSRWLTKLVPLFAQPLRTCTRTFSTLSICIFVSMHYFYLWFSTFHEIRPNMQILIILNVNAFYVFEIDCCAEPSLWNPLYLHEVKTIKADDIFI